HRDGLGQGQGQAVRLAHGHRRVLRLQRQSYAVSQRRPGRSPTKYDDPTWTFDKLLEVSKKLTKRTGGAPEQLGVDFSMSWNFLHPLVMSWGGDFFNYKTGEFRWTEAPATDAIQWMADLQLKQQVAPSAAENSSGAYKLEAGHLGFTWSTFNLAMYLLTTVKDQFEWDMVPPPHRPGQPA